MAFGRFEDTWHQRFPADRLVEAQPRIAVNHVDHVAPGDGSHRNRPTLLLLNGQAIRIVRDAQGKPLFECPRCRRRCRHIYLKDIACRECCGLDWSSRHLYRSLPGVHRIARWRRQLGADPRPFMPIPRNPHARHRQHALMRRIMAEEAKLVGHLAGIADDLERRLRRSGATRVQPDG